MAILATDTGGGGDFTPPPQGTHFGVCDMVVDLGNQRTTYMGDESIKHQIYVRWQIPSERVELSDADGNKRDAPMVIGKTYTLSLGEKANLRKDLQAWRGKAFTPGELAGFDVANLLGVAATITITHVEKNGKTYANVTGVGGIPKGMDKPKVEGDALIYDNENEGAYDKLPKWLREKLDGRIVPSAKPSPSDNGGYHPSNFGNDLDDDLSDVPF